MSINITDQLGNKITLANPAQRIVCLVPSLTETLCQMGLQNRVVGLTKFCVHPKGFKNKDNIIGGTKNINISKILTLKPCLVIVSKEENIKEQVDELKLHIPIYVSDITNDDTSHQALKSIAQLTAIDLNTLPWYNAFLQFINAPTKAPTLNCLYLIWKNPYMSVGADTFIHFMLQKAGYNNVLKNELRYPTVTENFIANNNIDVIFLSSEPFPFKQKHINEIQMLAPNAKVILVDGEIFSWYGYRTTKALSYFATLQQMLA
jgi:ABC-type Fe3+-hydroxamate transport system substrate-binding protein